MQRKYTVVYELTMDPLKGLDPNTPHMDAAEDFATEVALDTTLYHLNGEESESMELIKIELAE